MSVTKTTQTRLGW